MVFQCINIRQVPREVLKTAASGLGFQHLPRDLANVNAWKTMFDPYIDAQPLKKDPYATCRQSRPKSVCAFAGWSRPTLSAHRFNEYCRICWRTETAQIRLRGCARSPGTSLLAYDIRAFITRCAWHVCRRTTNTLVREFEFTCWHGSYLCVFKCGFRVGSSGSKGSFSTLHFDSEVQFGYRIHSKIIARLTFYHIPLKTSTR